MADSVAPVNSGNTNGADVATVGVADSELAPYELSQGKMLSDTLMFLFLLFVIFYFILIRPQQKKLKAHQEMLKVLKKGDKVITNGGLIGEVAKIEGDDVIVVEIAPNVRVKVARHSIGQLMKDQATAKTANDN